MLISREKLLAGKIALVTGATGLLGGAIAERLYHEGVNVIHNYCNNDKRAEELKRFGETYKADVNDYLQFEKMIEYVRNKYGHLDILINNYGPILYRDILDIEPSDFQKIILRNIMPVFHGCKLAGNAMMEQGRRGRIINIAAAGADEIKPKKKTVPYFIGKNAVIMLTRSFALEFAPYGITVNAVSPGIIEGLDNPEAGSRSGKFSGNMNERIKPDDISSIICFLCSENAGTISGEDINISSGIQSV
jgi:NAD(P)-dependent dehydrogenase (short-subunit alcohol dehydrogenase family)